MAKKSLKKTAKEIPAIEFNLSTDAYIELNKHHRNCLNRGKIFVRENSVVCKYHGTEFYVSK